MTLDLLSEPYNPLGNIGAEGISKLLGRSDLDFLELLIRESGQNVWDARIAPDARPRYVVRVRAFDERQMEVLREQVFSVLPESDDHECLPKLREFLQKARGEVLEIADFGTRGLGGPTDASHEPVGDEPTDFVDLIRNVGSRRDIAQGGGTYGYGKASLYAVSSCRTLIFDSRTVVGGQTERRLIGAALGHEYARGGRRYTGRHWWGNRNRESLIDPLKGSRADDISSALGLFDRSPKERGTTIAILNPDWRGLLGEDLDGEELDPKFIRERAARRIVEILLDNFWPKMLPKTLGSESAMGFKVLREEDRIVPIPSPDAVPPLDLYAEAWRRVQRAMAGDNGETEDLYEITWYRRRTGWLGIAERSGARPPQSRRYKLRAEGETNRAHHVALMRPAELVVCYDPSPPPDDEELEWGGVFIVDGTDDEVEQAFADAEPPPHNFWSTDNMVTEDRDGKSMVRVTLRRIREIVREIGATQLGNEYTQATGVAPLAQASQSLGRFLGGTMPTGGGPGDIVKPITGGGVGDSPITRLQYVGLELLDSAPIARFRTVLRRPVKGLTLHCQPLIVFEGKKDLQTPDGAQPEIVGWMVGDETIDAGDELYLEAGAKDSSIEILIRVPDGYAIDASLSHEESAQS